MADQYNDIFLSGIILLLFGAATVLTLKNKAEVIAEALGSGRQLRIYFAKHLLGICIMGLLPLFFFPQLEPYLSIPEMTPKGWFIFAVLTALVLFIGINAGKKFTVILSGTDIQAGDLRFFFPVRILFLIAYEWFFRGTLLPVTLEMFPLWASLSINVFFYALLHAGNDKREWIGTIPFGLVLCLFTLESGSVWPAALMHLALAMGNEPQVIAKTLPLLKGQRP